MAFGRVREPSERMCTSFLTYLVCIAVHTIEGVGKIGCRLVTCRSTHINMAPGCCRCCG